MVVRISHMFSPPGQFTDLRRMSTSTSPEQHLIRDFAIIGGQCQLRNRVEHGMEVISVYNFLFKTCQHMAGFDPPRGGSQTLQTWELTGG